MAADSGDGLVRAGPDLGGMASYPIGLAFTPDSRTLAIGNSDKHVYLWDVASLARPRRLGAPLTGPSGQTWAAAINPDGKTLGGGANDGTAGRGTGRLRAPALTATLGPARARLAVVFSPGGSQPAGCQLSTTTWSACGIPARLARERGLLRKPLGRRSPPRNGRATCRGVPYRAPCSLGRAAR